MPLRPFRLVACLVVFAAGARADDCADCNRKPNPYDGRDNAIGLLINDMYAQENRQKTFDNVEKYHRCLLSDKKERGYQSKYDSSYRYQIAAASESFSVPIALLTCLCGRESRFDSQEVSKTSTATGICQAMNDSLADVERWRKQIPALKQAWAMYVSRLGGRLEDPACASQPLSHDVLLRCPSLGIGVAALYLNYVYSRLDRKSRIASPNWQLQSLDTVTAVAGTYFLGAGLGEKAAKKSASRSEWPRALGNEVCDYAAARNLGAAWSKQRLAELRNHMAAVRTCVQDDHWLDHQGKPMAGECAMPPEKRAKQAQELQAFRASLVSECPSEP